MWEVEYKYILDWFETLDDNTIVNIFAALRRLESVGPALGRPLVDTLKSSKIKNLKELRPASSGRREIRIIFIFDPMRKAILLVGGDKSEGKNNRQKWSGWYKTAIPQAEKIYQKHLDQLGAYNG